MICLVGQTLNYNQPMKSFVNRFLSSCALALSAGVLLSVSCSHNPRKLSQLPPAKSVSLSNYTEQYIESPEMFPRERLRAERTLELRLSWAMRRATEDGRIRVRAIAPPLQLTGDPNIDLTLTHNVLLVADDLKPSQTFMDEYEVRIGPNPGLAIVRPARASDNLEDADNLMAEEQLARLRLDRQSVRAGHKYVETLKPHLTNHVMAATNAAAERCARMDTQIKELSATLTNAIAGKYVATNDVFGAETNKARADAMPETNEAEKAAKKTEVAKAEDKLNEARADLISAKAGVLSLELEIAQIRTGKRNLEADTVNLVNIVETFIRRGETQKAQDEALGVLETFWTEIVNGRDLFGKTNVTKKAEPYPMRSAVVVSFRAQALKGLQQVTLDVVRKNIETNMAAPTPAFKLGEDRVAGILKSLQTVRSQFSSLNGLLLADDDAVDSDSRKASLKIQGDLVNEAVGDLRAQIVLFNNGLAAPQTAPMPGFAAATGNNDGGNKPFGLMASLRSAATNFQAVMAETLAKVSITPEIRAFGDSGGTSVAGLTEVLDNSRAGLVELDTLTEAVKALPSEQNILSNKLQEIRALVTGVAPKLRTLAQQLKLAQPAITNTQPPSGMAGMEEVLAAHTNLSSAFERLSLGMAAVNNELALAEDRLPRAPAALAAESRVEADFTNAVGCVYSNLQVLARMFTTNKVSSSGKRSEAARIVTDLRHEISAAVTLAQGVRSARQQVNHILSGNPVQQDSVVASDAVASAGDVVGRILRGEQAVFRLNVLRGVVSTTAFLLPDDGAAQMFGQSFADSFYAAQVTFRNPNDKPILIYGNTMRLVVRMNAAEPVGIDEYGQLARKIWWATWEPLDYDALRRMIEGMQEHSWQRYLSKGIDLASLGLGFYGVAARPSEESLRFIAAFGGAAPQLKALLEADLKRNALNFREKGLNNIEEIPENGTLTRYVFLPKGPIYGTFAFGIAEANELPLSAEEGRNNPFKSSSRDFAKKALQPAYIHDIRREEVYVEGKRILNSDPLTPSNR